VWPAIGNTDMHFGNLSLASILTTLARGHFTLAPLYDMLPMPLAADAISGDLGLAPFTRPTRPIWRAPRARSRSSSGNVWPRTAGEPRLSRVGRRDGAPDCGEALRRLWSDNKRKRIDRARGCGM